MRNRCSASAPLQCALTAALLLAALPAHAEVYPTDRCVSEKLRAAAIQCQQVLGAWAGAAGDANSSTLQRRLARSAANLARAWTAAETRSAAAGVDCADTTATSAEMSELIQGRAAEIAATLNGEGDAAGQLRAGAQSCAAMLRAESQHLLHRSRDRDRSELRRQLAGAAGAGTVAGVESLVQEVVMATTVSPNVPSEWTLFEPEAQVEYLGKTLAPICSRGTPYAFFARRGTVNKLLVYYQGGGACWDFGTCEVLQTFDQAVNFDVDDPGNRDNPANFSGGFGDGDNPENPFRDWHAVFISYCTGDVHWGDATVAHESPAGEVAVIEHKGFVNAQAVEKWTREHFVNPEQVFVTGSSAGAYGAIVNSLSLQEFVYPSSDFAVLGDAGNGVITQDFLEFEISKWGVEQNLPAWIPALDVPLTELNAADLWVASAEFYPENRFATYTAAYDGSTGGQTGFYNIMLHPFREDPLAPILIWRDWWIASCAWNEEMRALNAEAVSRAPNFRFYVGTGSRHTMWGSDKVYTSTEGGESMTILDWVKAMLAGGSDWSNVECSDCGLLLEGDPSPDLQDHPFDPNDLDDVPGADQPFTEEGRIVCDG